ncbi:MAG: hypothetical protein AAB250_15605 [Bdellovibrionota bacterium]
MKSQVRTLKLVVLAFASVATLAACGNKNKDENGNQGGQVRVADVPARECVQPYMRGTYQQGYNPYQSSSWTPYQQAGFYPYDTRVNGGCQPGSFPVCTGGIGLSCVPTHLYSHSTVAWYSPYSNGGIRVCGYAGYGGSTAGCSSYQESFMGPGAFGRSCLVNVRGSCGYDYCQPLAYGSSVGVCVQ